MSAGDGREFVDTNILVYAFDAAAGEKRARAAQLLRRLWESGGGCLSVQVLQEFFVTVTRKVHPVLPPADARAVVAEFAAWPVHRPNAADVLAAIDLHLRHGVSFWDALILRSARQFGCPVLWSEDLADGAVYDGVRVTNPFAGG